MLAYGSERQKKLAIYLLKEIFPNDSTIITAMFEKIMSPMPGVRLAAIEAFRHLTLDETQINNLISLLNEAIEKKKWINQAWSVITEIFFGRAILGIEQNERIQIIGTLCHFISWQEKLAQFNIIEEIGSSDKSNNVLKTIKEDLFGKAGENIILEQLQTQEKLYSLWKELHSLVLFDNILNNNLLSNKTLDKDVAITLLSNDEVRIKYFYQAENRLIGIPELIRILNIGVDFLDQKLLENEDFDIADDAFETLFMN